MWIGYFRALISDDELVAAFVIQCRFTENARNAFFDMVYGTASGTSQSARSDTLIGLNCSITELQCPIITRAMQQGEQRRWKSIIHKVIRAFRNQEGEVSPYGCEEKESF